MTDIIHINLGEIDVSVRLRGIDEEWAKLLAESISKSGLQDPIWVKEQTHLDIPYRLIAGGHRYRAHELNLATTIQAIIKDVDDLEAQELEIIENLHRRELSAYDKAKCVAELQRIYEEKHPETKNGGDRKSVDYKGKNQTAQMSFCFSASEKTGLTDRHIRRMVARWNRLSDQAKDLIKDTPIADNGSYLDKIGNMDRDIQHKIVEIMLIHKKSPAEAEAIFLDKPEPCEVEKKKQAIKKAILAADPELIIEVLAEMGFEITEKQGNTP